MKEIIEAIDAILHVSVEDLKKLSGLNRQRALQAAQNINEAMTGDRFPANPEKLRF